MKIKTLCLLLPLINCAPILIGGGAAVLGGMSLREKGISGTLDDTSLTMKVRNNLRKRDLDWRTHLSQKVGVCVHSGEVLLTGMVTSKEEALWAEQVAWEIFGVKSVINQIQVGSGHMSSYAAKDAWITTKCKSTIMTHSQINVRGLNYSLKTVDGIVYVMGISRTVREQQLVLNTIARVKGVRKVICLARFKEEVLS